MSVSYTHLSKNDIGYLYEKDDNIKEECIDLIKSKNVYMTLSSREIQGSYEFIKYAKGKVGVVGLGPVSYTHLDVYKRQCSKCYNIKR